MNRNHLVQIAAVALMAISLIGSALLVEPIKRQRLELQLTITREPGESLPPSVVFATAALGSFRGLAVDYLWYRANELKEAGKFYEANQLAEWITTLQPQFPQVWAFHGWNMAYNISVATYTPEERWDWVQKGINLLRDKGVVYNSNAPRVYRELGWIFFHKVGQFSDDMHWYYKSQMAFQWQRLMGAPSDGATTEQVVEAFRKIPDSPDSLKILVADHPDVAVLVQRLAAINHTIVDEVTDKPNEDLLRQIGMMDMFGSSIDARFLGVRYEQLVSSYDRKLWELVHEEGQRPTLDKLLNFMRKKVLKRIYHMDPVVMLDLMEYKEGDPDDFGLGPLDWRHPLAHAAYWSAMGVRVGQERRNKKDIDELNMDRMVIFCAQNLSDFGRINFDPVSMAIDMSPDPRFIAAYDRWFEAAKVRAASGEFGDPTIDSFDAGHENFLQKAVFNAYVYGDEQQAQLYYRKLRTLYGSKEHNVRDNKYLQQLPDFVLSYMKENLDLQGNTSAFIDGMLDRAFIDGLAHDRSDIFAHFMNLARTAHKRFQGKSVATPNAPQDRMSLLPFEKILSGRFGDFMIAPQFSPLTRAHVWNAAPSSIRQEVYDRVREKLKEQCAEARLDPAVAFPEPQGMEQYRLTHAVDKTQQREVMDQQHIKTERQ